MTRTRLVFALLCFPLGPSGFACDTGGGGGTSASGSDSSGASTPSPACVAALARQGDVAARLDGLEAGIRNIDAETSREAAIAAAAVLGRQRATASGAAEEYRGGVEALTKQKSLARSIAADAGSYASGLRSTCAEHADPVAGAFERRALEATRFAESKADAARAAQALAGRAQATAAQLCSAGDAGCTRTGVSVVVLGKAEPETPSTITRDDQRAPARAATGPAGAAARPALLTSTAITGAPTIAGAPAAKAADADSPLSGIPDFSGRHALTGGLLAFVAPALTAEARTGAQAAGGAPAPADPGKTAAGKAAPVTKALSGAEKARMDADLSELDRMLTQTDSEKRAAARAVVEQPDLTLFQRVSKQYREHAERLF